jgi:hypothetical protein
MFDQLSAEILASLIKGFPTTTTRTTTTKQNVDPAVHFVYSRVKSALFTFAKDALRANQGQAIKGRVLSYQYTKMALEPQQEILAKQALNTKCLELNRA